MATKEVYISSSDPFSVVACHGPTSEIFDAEQDGEEYGWPQDFYRDTSAYVRFQDGSAVEIILEDDEL
ncbi:MAG: hypothetical protein E6J34_15515 [Chloroflexi bacterium]|nr:MAG: hypothetical protein E6J34_15515 [Chloroflexota bacterium]